MGYGIIRTEQQRGYASSEVVSDENNCMPQAVVGDEAFFQEDFLTYYRTHGIEECPCGSRTPWPNRPESAVRLFKRQRQIMSKNLEDDRFKGVTIREAVKRTVLGQKYSTHC